MTLLVKDANTAVQSLSTQTDAAGALVPAHVPAVLSGGIAIPVAESAPLPVINTAGSAAADGSGTIATGGTAQSLFGGMTPTNGYLVANNSTGVLYVSDVGTATGGGTSVPIAAGAVWQTPPGYKPPGAVSIYGATTGQAFAARRW